MQLVEATSGASRAARRSTETPSVLEPAARFDFALYRACKTPSVKGAGAGLPAYSISGGRKKINKYIYIYICIFNDFDFIASYYVSAFWGGCAT
jgi:hypothetical protein